jgi:hypothetical protein
MSSSSGLEFLCKHLFIQMKEHLKNQSVYNKTLIWSRIKETFSYKFYPMR